MKRSNFSGGVLIWAAASFILTFSLTSAQTQNATHGEACDENIHCQMNSGLICNNEGHCACSSGRLSDKYGYDLEWVPTALRCLSKLGSVCVGTEESPILAGQLPCVGAAARTARCVQIAGLPLGVGVCQEEVDPLALHGQPCSETRHCDSSLGLICSGGLCSCTGGALTQSLQYNLQWNSTIGRCVGNVGSACVGTRDTPLPTVAKRIGCVPHNGCVTIGPASRQCTLADVSCEQVPELPLGIGYCRENLPDQENTTPGGGEEGTTSGGEGTTPHEDPPTTSSAKTSTSPFLAFTIGALLLSISLLPLKIN